jgi:Flp pilus assembly protein TadG
MVNLGSVLASPTARPVGAGAAVVTVGVAISRRGVRDLGWDQQGSMVVETAVVLPVFFLLLFGLFSFSLVLFNYSNATYAARAAARYASLHSNTSLAPCSTSCVQSYATLFLFAAPAVGTTVNTIYGSLNTVGGTVKVSVTIAYPVAIPFSSLTQITVGSSAQ